MPDSVTIFETVINVQGNDLTDEQVNALSYNERCPDA